MIFQFSSPSWKSIGTNVSLLDDVASFHRNLRTNLMWDFATSLILLSMLLFARTLVYFHMDSTLRSHLALFESEMKLHAHKHTRRYTRVHFNRKKHGLLFSSKNTNHTIFFCKKTNLRKWRKSYALTIGQSHSNEPRSAWIRERREDFFFLKSTKSTWFLFCLQIPKLWREKTLQIRFSSGNIGHNASVSAFARRSSSSSSSFSSSFLLLLVPVHSWFQIKGRLLRMDAMLRMKATRMTEMAAISTHMMDWYGWVGSARQPTIDDVTYANQSSGDRPRPKFRQRGTTLNTAKDSSSSILIGSCQRHRRLLACRTLPARPWLATNCTSNRPEATLLNSRGKKNQGQGTFQGRYHSFGIASSHLTGYSMVLTTDYKRIFKDIRGWKIKLWKVSRKISVNSTQ